jgi:transcription termination factor Rho
MSVLDRAALEASPLADLHAIATELSLDGYRRLRKADLIERIIARQNGEEAPAEPEAAAETETGAESDAPAPRQRRTRTRAADRASDRDRASTSGRASTSARAPAPDPAPGADRASDADEEEAEEARTAAGRRRRGRRGGRGRGAGREEIDGATADTEVTAVSQGDSAAETVAAVPSAERAESRRDHDETPVEGVVELLANGSGFVRVSPPEVSDEDVYISAAQVKRCELVSGDRVAGPKRPPRRSERFASLIRIDMINGRPASELADGARYDDLPAAFPSDRFRLGSEDPTLKAIEWLTPFGRGSRVTIAGSSRAGKSHALRQLAGALAGDEKLQLLVALSGVRPEEISEWSAGPVEPGSAVSFAASTDAQDNAVELVVDQARRIAARGADAVVLIDTLDGMHPHAARKVLAAAKNIADGGSLTIVATATEPVGGETTVIALDATLTSTGRFPALDLVVSGTLRPELLVGDAGAEAIAAARAEVLNG